MTPILWNFSLAPECGGDGSRGGLIGADAAVKQDQSRSSLTSSAIPIHVPPTTFATPVPPKVLWSASIVRLDTANWPPPLAMPTRRRSLRRHWVPTSETASFSGQIHSRYSAFAEHFLHDFMFVEKIHRNWPL